MNVEYITIDKNDSLDLSGGEHFIDIDIEPAISSTKFSEFSVDFQKRLEAQAKAQGHALRCTKIEILSQEPVYNAAFQATDYNIEAFRVYVVPTGIPVVLLILLICLIVAAVWGVKAVLRGVGKFTKESGKDFSYYFILPVVVVIMAYFFLVYKGKARLK